MNFYAMYLMRFILLFLIVEFVSLFERSNGQKYQLSDDILSGINYCSAFIKLRGCAQLAGIFNNDEFKNEKK